MSPRSYGEETILIKKVTEEERCRNNKNIAKKLKQIRLCHEISARRENRRDKNCNKFIRLRVDSSSPGNGSDHALLYLIRDGRRLLVPPAAFRPLTQQDLPSQRERES